MSTNNLMTPLMLAKQLNTGSATIRFWLNRFSKWLPYTEKDGEKLYPADTLNTLLLISTKIDSGMLPTEIENSLDVVANSSIQQPSSHLFQSVIPSLQSVIQDIPNLTSANQPLPINDSIRMISALFEKFYSQQERIAAAEERKADAEEKKAKAEEQKAEALAKRAEAELHKANAMNNLADAIKNVSADFLKSLSAGNLFSGLTPPQQPSQPQQPSATAQTQQVIDPSSVNSDVQINTEDILNGETDDLSALIEEEDDEIDDLSALIEEEDNEIDDLSALIEDEKDKIDDLSALIEDEDNEIDDLSALIEEEDNEIDDLSALIDDEKHNDVIPEILDSDVDDLMSLIDDTQASDHNLLDTDNFNSGIMDDLSALIDEKPTDLSPNILDSDVDDLMSLIDDEEPKLLQRKDESLKDNNSLDNDIMDDLAALDDDLSALIEAENTSLPPPPKIEKPKASLEKNFEQYKSEVVNIIIKLRKEGHTVDKTTELLNNEDIKPLSGKNRWTTKMIAKIYKFIEAAQK